jgi:hypothetical protein
VREFSIFAGLLLLGEEPHERLRAGCNGGNSWNYFEKTTLDFTGMTSKSVANGIGVLPRNQQEESWQNWGFAAFPSARKPRTVGPKGSDSEGVLESISSLGRIGNSGEEDNKVLRQWLATALGHEARQYASGSHN